MNDQESKTPKRSRRNSLKDSQKSPENVIIPVLKTPRRTRRTSVQESQLELPKIEESNGVLTVSKMDPITPGKSTRTLDLRTPSRSENLAAVQTPRRSCRKSIKPIQEYENIVAQKGLSVKGKRLLNEQITSEEADEAASSTAAVELRENKWTAADIGRVSTKRSKKKRNKAKELKRQKKIVQENEDEQLSVEPSDDLVETTEKVTNKKETVDQSYDEEKNKEEATNVEENLNQNDELEENKENDIVPEKASEIVNENETEIDEHSDRRDELEEKNEDKVSLNESPKVDEPTDKEEEDTETKSLSSEVIPPPVLQSEEDNAVESDDSMDEGDIILNGMPVTGDDCMQDEEDVIRKETTSTAADDCIQSPEKLLQQDQRCSLLVTPAADPGNKSDDSDCIMLSLNDDSSRRNSSRRPSSVVGQSKFEANESSDSAGINMPPLIVCSDDEDDDEEFVDALKSQEGGQNEAPLDDKEIETLDGTFVTKDNEEEKCNDIEVYPVEDEELIDNVIAPEEENIIDIVMGPEEIRKIVLGIEQDPIDITTPPIQKDEQMSPLNETFDADDLTKTVAGEVATPKGLTARSSVTRHLTPFKTNTNILPDIIIEPEEELEEPIKIIIESRQNKLKSSRKRSFSFCVDRPKKNVTFHSPSNVTMNIYDGDLIKSVAKKTPTNITKRRKRSLSVTETDRDLMDYIQRKKPAQNIATTPQKKKSPHTSKIKMPNFSNIHQKQFQRMESITDHVARRAERAKILINSSTKIKPASVQKGLPVKNSVLREQNKDGNKTQIPKPKARQRIDMSGGLENKANIKTRSKPKQDLGLLDDLPLLGKTPTKPSANSTVLFKQNNINKPPNPKFNFNFNSTALPSCGNATVASAAPRVHLPNPRDFNLSTQITYPTTTSHAPKVEKVEDRRKRMMEMFKSKTTHRVVENKKEILKGVRTNRRFELQMMCRNRQN